MRKSVLVGAVMCGLCGGCSRSAEGVEYVFRNPKSELEERMQVKSDTLIKTVAIRWRAYTAGKLKTRIVNLSDCAMFSATSWECKDGTDQFSLDGDKLRLRFGGDSTTYVYVREPAKP